MKSLWLCATVLFISACSLQANTRNPTPVPDGITYGGGRATFSLDIKPSVVKSRILKSGCGEASTDMSRLGFASGLITRPSSSDELYLDQGEAADGAKWLALKKHSEPDVVLCGIILTEESSGTRVSLAGVRQRNIESAVKSVKSGEFFCKCKQLGE